MSKKTVLSFLTLSGLILASVPVAAEGTAPIDSSTPLAIVPPTSQAEATPTVPSSQKSASIQTTSPAAPNDSSDIPSTQPSQSSQPSQPSEPATQLNEPVTPVAPSEPASGTSSSSDSSSSSSSNQQPTSPSSGETKVSASSGNQNSLKSQKPIGNPDASTAPAYSVKQDDPNASANLSAISPGAPVVTESGYTIIGTFDSNPIIQNQDGSTAVVPADKVGAIVNPDKTVTVKTFSGEEKTLPITGEKTSAVGLIGGLILMLVSVLGYLGLKRKMKA